ncbi:MAG: heme lyase CcmF/NrfE family subunit [Deltaproteobacteria bacterium]|nr:MAG: heme lyase CcmF/NrfE family subunit [Deltaproteobacteria bacterium]
MSDIGYFALQLALAFSLVGFGWGIYASLDPRPERTRVLERLLLAVSGFTTLAITALFVAFATFDFQLEYVASHSARSMPLHYRLGALWGGQEGSLLLWLFMLCAYGAAAVFVHHRSSRALMPWVCTVLLANCAFFLVLINFTSNPFDKIPTGHVLSDGQGLNPLLQHPAMMIHPLFLYLGFVGFAVPFAFALAALLSGALDASWFRVTRRWTLIPWFFLSIGIILGGRWAYEVLGWGGYWAWDPVENASFMPWLAATAYLHSVMIQEKRDMLKIWNMALIGLTYALCLFGTFLTRSGIVQSVHAFAQTEWFGTIFLSYVLVTSLVFFAALYARRGRLRTPHRIESIASREAGFLINNWVFMAILLVVFWGTLFPVFSEALTGSQITVGPQFFNTMAGPLALFLLFLTGVGPLIAWRRSSLTSLRRQFVWPGIAGLLTAALLPVFGLAGSFYSHVAFSLGAFVMATIAQEYWRAIRVRMRSHAETPLAALGTLLRKNQQRYGGYIIHLGAVFVLLGAAGSAFNEELLQNVAPGDAIELRDYRIEYLTARPIPAQHYGGAVARLALYRRDEPLATMVPEKREYWLEEQPSSVPSIYSTLREDLYVILTAIEPDGSATLKVYCNPLVNWIWIGALAFVVGTAVVVWPHPARTTG